MKKNTSEHSFKYNLSVAFLAQFVSFLFSLTISLILPKFLSVSQFSYWQLFTFFSTYVSCTQLGLTDGIYLRLGGKRYQELDHRCLGQQFWLLFFWQLLVLLIICAFCVLLIQDPNRRFVYIMVGIYMVIYNLSRYIGFLFQAVNNTSVFSKASLIDRISILLIGLFIGLLGLIKWQYCIIIYVIGITISLAYTFYNGKEIVRQRFSIKEARTVIPEVKANISAGINLMVANVASTLIVGIVRFVVDLRWGLDAFGIFSFSVSLVNFFLMFINQISMVLFPALRRIDSNEMPVLYAKIRGSLSLLLPLIYLAYVPAKIIVGFWLPQYSKSLQYLLFLLPVCIFDGKMQLLLNTYLKVIRKEKFMLRINLLAGAISFIGSAIGAYLINNIYSCIFVLLFSIVLRSVVSEIYLARQMRFSCFKNIAFDMVFLIVFLISSLLIKNLLLCEVVLLFTFIANIIINRTEFIAILSMFTNKIKRLR